MPRKRRRPYLASGHLIVAKTMPFLVERVGATADNSRMRGWPKPSGSVRRRWRSPFTAEGSRHRSRASTSYKLQRSGETAESFSRSAHFGLFGALNGERQFVEVHITGLKGERLTWARSLKRHRREIGSYLRLDQVRCGQEAPKLFLRERPNPLLALRLAEAVRALLLSTHPEVGFVSRMPSSTAR